MQGTWCVWTLCTSISVLMHLIYTHSCQPSLYLALRSVLIIDNCQIHHVFGVEELCEAQCICYVILL
jgi:hypothetical protein